MKQIFTLITMLAIVHGKTKAQSQNFNDQTSWTNTQASCWTTTGMAYSTTNPIEGTGQLYIAPSTSTVNNNNAQSNSGTLSTPFINFNAGTTIQFSYQLTSKLANNAIRSIIVGLSDGTTTTTLQTFTLSGGADPTVHTDNVVIPANSGIKKLVFNFNGNGDGNTGMYFDNLVINAPYSYNTSNCAALTTNNSTLPVYIISFTGNFSYNRANLNWTVGENETGDHFDVEKSYNGTNFTTTALVMNTAKEGAESYTYADVNCSGTQYYRLKITNKNGIVSYSKTIILKDNSKSDDDDFTLLQNPVTSSLSFTYTANISELYTLNLYSTSGVVVYSTQLMLQKGMNTVSLALDGRIIPGIYVMQMHNGSGTVVISRRIIK